MSRTIPVPDDPGTTRACCRCSVTKPLNADHFHFTKGRYNAACKDCRNSALRKSMEDPDKRAAKHARDQERRSTDEGRRKNKEQSKRYRERNREKVNAAHRERYRQDPDKHYRAVRSSLHKRLLREPDLQRERNRRYYEANRERLIAAAIEYERANPEVKNTSRQRRRAVEGSHTTAEWLALCEIYGGVCLCCGVDGPLSRDHIVPVSSGGTNDIGNIQPLCAPCNSRKHTKSIDYRTGAGDE